MKRASETPEQGRFDQVRLTPSFGQRILPSAMHLWLDMRNALGLAGIEVSRQPVAFIAAFRAALLTITPNPTHF
jgi:hypothetical protein